MSCINILTCCIFSTVAVQLDAARILAVFPTPSISHQIAFRPLTQELARRGHDVIVITPDPAFSKSQSPANLTEIDVHDISYSTWINELKKVSVGGKSDMDAQFRMFIHLFTAIFEQQLYHKEVQELIASTKKYDLILVEACVRPALIFSHIFKAPVVQMSSFGAMVDTYPVLGAPNHPLFQPVVVRQRLYNLTIWEKIREIYQQFKHEFVYYEHANVESDILKNIFGQDTPTVHELSNNVDMVFLNVHPIWNDNVPVPPGVIYMGGIHQQPAKELPKELLTYLESSKNGAIYVSFGTNVQTSIIPPHTVKIMKKVFSELPYDVIWRWDADFTNKPRNIKIYKWLPQSDLLRHSKVKLFITQGGLQSTDEAITGGVPLIGIPVIADQWYNVEKYLKLGIGKKLEMGTFTEEEFRDAIVTIIENSSYRDNIRRLRTLIYDQPQTPLDRAIWWIEHVLRHGGTRHLRCPAANMSLTKYYEVKLIVSVLTFLFITIAIIIMILIRLQQYIFKNNIIKFKTS